MISANGPIGQTTAAHSNVARGKIDRKRQINEETSLIASLNKTGVIEVNDTHMATSAIV